MDERNHTTVNTQHATQTTPAPAIMSDSALATAHWFGEFDAQHGQSCVPEWYFARMDMKVAYCQGYQSITGPTLTTEYFLGKAA